MRKLIEANEDEENKDEGNAEASTEDNASEGQPSGNEQPMVNLDLRAALCFGYSVPIVDSWVHLAKQADNLGWKLVDVKQLERSLAQNVEAAYMSIASFKLMNIDDDMEYILRFDNNRQLWDIDVANSPKAQIDLPERSDIFKSELANRIAKQTYSRLVDALETYQKIVEPHLKNGELLLVDTVKLDAILHFLNSEHFLQNVLNLKYLTIDL